MYSVQYGNQTIEYSIQVKEGLKSHYISVEKGFGVVLKGKATPLDQSNKLILKKAKWILDKLDLVSSISDGEIVTGSRILYLGKKYYVELIINEGLNEIKIDFTESKFAIHLPTKLNTQSLLKEKISEFYKEKAIGKIKPRINKWSKTTGLSFAEVKFKQLDKSWGSCTPNNKIIISLDAIKLPFSLIDYLIVHELVHTKVKNHSKEFWAELSKHIINWKELDEKMYGMKL